MLRRVGFGRYEIVQQAAAPLVPLERAGVYTGGTTGPRLKTPPQRNRRLLDLAAGKPCLLLVPGQCNHRLDTTVACHSNLSIHGKGERRKADDHWSCWGCSACHWWLDFAGVRMERKTPVFMAGMSRQLLAWREIERDTTQPQADRRAVRWAFERHTTTGD